MVVVGGVVSSSRSSGPTRCGLTGMVAAHCGVRVRNADQERRLCNDEIEPNELDRRWTTAPTLVSFMFLGTVPVWIRWLGSDELIGCSCVCAGIVCVRAFGTVNRDDASKFMCTVIRNVTVVNAHLTDAYTCRSQRSQRYIYMYC